MKQGTDPVKALIAVRARLNVEERAFSRARAAYIRGEATDMLSLSIQQSEVDALRAISRSLLRQSLASKPQREVPAP